MRALARRTRRSVLSALAGLALWSALAPGFAAEVLAPPQQVSQDLYQRVATLLGAGRERLVTDRRWLGRRVDEVLLPHLDLDGLTGLVLGPHAHRATPAQRPAQRAAFLGQWQTLLINTFAHALQQIGPWELRLLAMRPVVEHPGPRGSGCAPRSNRPEASRWRLITAW